MKDNKLPLEILVDTTCACENIQRLATNKGYQIETEKLGEIFQITLTK